jgi:hypothetical protein
MEEENMAMGFGFGKTKLKQTKDMREREREREIKVPRENVFPCLPLVSMFALFLISLSSSLSPSLSIFSLSHITPYMHVSCFNYGKYIW